MDIKSSVLDIIYDRHGIYVDDLNISLREMDFDSLDEVDFVMTLEEEFEIVMDEDYAITGDTTVQDIINAVEEKLNGN